MAKPVLVIISGYFSPLHCGHLDMIEAGAECGDQLAVIVNNNGMIRDYKLHASTDASSWGEPVAQGLMVGRIGVV